MCQNHDRVLVHEAPAFFVLLLPVVIRGVSEGSLIPQAPLYEGMSHYLDALSIYESQGFELVNLALVCRTHSGGLKLDTQGYDLKVFAGATGCLDRIMVIQSELSVSRFLARGYPSPPLKTFRRAF